MEDLPRLASLIRMRNALEREITSIIGRPAQVGHVGEYIASRIFNIKLEKSATHKGSDGYFTQGPLQGRTVDIKYYPLLEGFLDINPNSLPDFYLVLAGPKSPPQSSRGRSRPWTIRHIFLFDAHDLVERLNQKGLRIGIATSISQDLWENAQIYPTSKNNLLNLSKEQRDALKLFESDR